LSGSFFAPITSTAHKQQQQNKLESEEETDGGISRISPRPSTTRPAVGPTAAGSGQQNSHDRLFRNEPNFLVFTLIFA
jgi:hypothetical protein